MKARSIKCPSCGKQHVPGFAFCQRCGAPLGAAVEHDAISSHDAGPLDDVDESTFQAVSPASARQFSTRGRNGCAATTALLVVAVIVLLLRAVV